MHLLSAQEDLSSAAQAGAKRLYSNTEYLNMRWSAHAAVAQQAVSCSLSDLCIGTMPMQMQNGALFVQAG